MPESTEALGALLVSVQRENAAIRDQLTEIMRAIRGDPDNNMPSLRQAVKELKGEVTNEVASINDRLEVLEQRATNYENKFREQEAYLRGITTIGKWIGGGSLLTAVLGLIQLANFLGGGK